MKNLLFIPVVLGGAYLVGACTAMNAVTPEDYSSALPVEFVTAGTVGTDIALSAIFNDAAGTDTTMRGVKDTAVVNFLTGAAMGGMKEIEMGKLVQQKATNPRVKAFGAMMVKDHTMSNAELKQIAASKKLPLPDAVPTHEGHDFMKKTGKIFDQEYMTMMVKDHQKTIGLFERAASNVADPQLKAFAKKTIPVLQRHLDSAKVIYGSLKPWNQ